MAALDPSVSAARRAVRAALLARRDRPARAGEPPAGGRLALVAGSGGADSLALAATAAFVAPRAGWRVGLLTVDHGLQDGSRARAEALAGWAGRAGLAPVEVLTVSVAGRAGGPEAAARAARYGALAAAAVRVGAEAVLLGHTRDDQAETVLLALARGSGPRGLAGMPARRDRHGLTWLRPLLALSRSQTRQVCAELSLEPWDDPHNTDPAYARARVRASVLPALVAALGERVIDNLARTAGLVAADNEALDALAAEALVAARAGPETLAVSGLRDLPVAVRTRALHGWLRELRVPGGKLSHRHVEAVDALVMHWRGQGPTQLPGGRTVRRRGGELIADDDWRNPARSGLMGE